ncbi:esterase/lipase family protein [Actinomycetospora atypica]|uniref:Esterase/lipase family protein n=1 Tax=Actinomycetospora atypica TaxID=1290095 RepID=A0ABV9YQ19_9PSEU
MASTTRTGRVLLGAMEWAGQAAMRRPAEPRPGPDTTRAAEPGPVVVVGGFFATAPVMAPLAEGLTARGHEVRTVVEGAAAGCARRATDSLTREVEALAVRHGRPVHLVGHSRGGQFARVATARVPRSVASLTTLGTPFALYGLGSVALGIGGAVAVAGSLGVPGLATLTCLLGDCCRSYRADLTDPWAAGVPYTTITGADDRTVPGAAGHDEGSVQVAVPGGHLDLLTSARAHHAVAEAIDRAALAARAA